MPRHYFSFLSLTKTAKMTNGYIGNLNFELIHEKLDEDIQNLSDIPLKLFYLFRIDFITIKIFMLTSSGNEDIRPTQ